MAGGGPGFELRVLGPVQAVRDGRELALGGPQAAGGAGVAAVAAGRVVPAERLAEELWGGSPPPGAAGTLRSYVSRLRSALGPDAALVARGGGYALAAAPDQLDAARFERLVGAGREALGRGEAAAAANRFREALGLWRGPALADVADVEPLAREGARLEELRLVAVEGRIEADLELGLAAEVAGELEGLVAEHPVRERLWRLLVLALYRAGGRPMRWPPTGGPGRCWPRSWGSSRARNCGTLERAVLRQEVPAAAPRRAQHNLPAQLTSFRGPGAGTGRAGGAARRGAAGHADRGRRGREDPAGGGVRRGRGGAFRRRGVAGRSGRRSPIPGWCRRR